MGQPPPPLNALEILRETSRLLRADSSPFINALLLIAPVSAALLTTALVPAAAARSLSRHLLLLAAAAGLPVPRILSRLSLPLLSAATSLPLLLPARAAVSYSVACAYANETVDNGEFLAEIRRIWPRILSTYLSACVAISAYLALVIAVVLLICGGLRSFGYPPEIVAYPAVVVLAGFFIIYAWISVVCDVAVVVSVLEDASLGPAALLRAGRLVRGRTMTGVVMFLGLGGVMAFVEWLFEHRVRTVSYGDGSSRMWEGPLLVLMHSFVVLIGLMMSAVFYFTCSVEVENDNGCSDEGDEMISSELMEGDRVLGESNGEHRVLLG